MSDVEPWWRWCRCGHLMMLHDVADMAGSDPMCCVDGCSQQGCRGLTAPRRPQGHETAPGVPEVGSGRSDP